MNRAETKRKKIFSPYMITIITLTVLAIGCFIAFSYSTELADIVQGYIGGPIRFMLAKLTDLIPFSFAEFLLISSPIILFLATRFAIKHYSDTWYLTIYFMTRTLSVICIIAIIFVFGFAGGYKGRTIDQKLSIERRDLSASDLRITAEYLLARVNELSSEVDFVTDSFSVMPYSFREMTNKLNDAYVKLSEEHSFIQCFKSNPKQVVLSEPWTYTHISGVYTFFTGESNVNINFPDYTIPYTCAHEMAHQRGISREDEANFVAFLACERSDDPYIRYSGYLSMYEYVRNALYSADREAYSEVASSVDRRVQYEMKAYSDFFDKYRENVVANVSGTINNGFLQSQGTAGTKSYGMVVDLTCAYVKALYLAN